MIKDIDDKTADPMDLSDIWHESTCINCKKGFTGFGDIIFTRLKTGRLIWWHSRSSCMHKLSTVKVADDSYDDIIL